MPKQQCQGIELTTTQSEQIHTKNYRHNKTRTNRSIPRYVWQRQRTGRCKQNRQTVDICVQKLHSYNSERIIQIDPRLTKLC